MPLPISSKIYKARFLFGPHKDKIDKTKLRPVAVGGSWRRAFTSTIVRHNIQLFTDFLAPYSYVNGVRG